MMMKYKFDSKNLYIYLQNILPLDLKLLNCNLLVIPTMAFNAFGVLCSRDQN